MLHFHATKKLLNTSRLNSLLYLSEPAAGQYLHHWYVVLSSSGFRGKFLLLYVHEPSLLTVLVKGKTIASTFDTFRKQLKKLLHRHNFPVAFIEKEMSFADDYIIGKTNNKSMLAHINHMVLQVTAFNLHFASYDEIDTDIHEDLFMDWLSGRKGQKNYETVLEFWKNKTGEFRDDQKSRPDSK
jgi:hypothetical protein